MNRLANKNALVIGSATGIGAAVAELYAAEGANVVIADFGRQEARDALVSRLKEGGSKSFAIDCDVRRADDVKGAVDATVSRLGGLDIMVNNAGIGATTRPVAEQDWDEWEQVIAVNLRGVAYGMKFALDHMLPRGYGRIINTASQLAHKPAPGNAAYCASKAGVVALTVSTAQEVATSGVTVNCVCPGPTDTPLWRACDPEWNAWKLSTLPIKRIGTPKEVAWAYVFLASDEATYMIGQSLSPNGGDVMW